MISDASPTATAAGDVIVGGYLQHLRDELALVACGARRADSATIAGGRRSFLWLTENEAQAFSKEMRDVIERYVATATRPTIPPTRVASSACSRSSPRPPRDSIRRRGDDQVLESRASRARVV